MSLLLQTIAQMHAWRDAALCNARYIHKMQRAFGVVVRGNRFLRKRVEAQRLENRKLRQMLSDKVTECNAVAAESHRWRTAAERKDAVNMLNGRPPGWPELRYKSTSDIYTEAWNRAFQ